MVGAALGTSSYQVLFSMKEAPADEARAKGDYESYKMTELSTTEPENLAIE